MAGESKKSSMIARVGKLYALFERYFPDHRSKQGVLDIPRLARDMGFAHETLYRCVRKNEIRVPVALDILRYSHEAHPEQPLYWQDLLPYVLPEFEEFSDPAEKLVA